MAQDRERSCRSLKEVHLRMLNETLFEVDIIWVNYLGQHVKYKKLPINGYFDINTYETHPWIAIASATKQRLMINRRFVYMPRTCDTYRLGTDEQSPINSNVTLRVSISVTKPMYTLRQLSMFMIRSILKTQDDVNDLGLPIELQQDLKLSMEERQHFISITEP